jgi:hypothetical protein
MSVTALYPEKDDIIVRGFEADGKSGQVHIEYPGLKKIIPCDLCLNPLPEKDLSLSAYEIKTLRLLGADNA